MGKGKIDEAIGQFRYEGVLIDERPYGSGHINDTYLLTFEIAEMGTIKVILQRMNKNIFTKPIELMENILNVTSYLRKKIIENGGDPDRETLNVIRTVDNMPYFVDSEGEYWRSYKFITDATSYDQVESPEDFYQSAVAFGNFQRLLAEYPAETLHETIEGFHDTKARFQVFKKAVEDDVCGRAASVQKEIQFVLEHEHLANVFADLLEKKEIPLRVTHNDTKCNNVLFDSVTKEPIVVIDLDTIMPGMSMYDFADAVRFIANTAVEDEPDTSKVFFDTAKFRAFANGFIGATKDSLTEIEIENLVKATFSITIELASRFLDDYITGDKYFRCEYPKHNLVRTRCPLQLAKDIARKTDELEWIIRDVLEKRS